MAGTPSGKHFARLAQSIRGRGPEDGAHFVNRLVFDGLHRFAVSGLETCGGKRRSKGRRHHTRLGDDCLDQVAGRNVKRRVVHLHARRRGTSPESVRDFTGSPLFNDDAITGGRVPVHGG